MYDTLPTIEKNVPIPATRREKTGFYRTLALQMGAGDSVLLRRKQVTTFRKTVRTLFDGRLDVVERRVSAKHQRVWVVAVPKES